MKVLIKEDFNDTMINLRDKVKNTYDYLKGNRTNNLGTLHDASSAEIKSNATLYKLTQEFDKSKAPYRVQFDKMGKKLLFTFNASKVPTDLVDKFKPNGKYGKKVNSYDPSSQSVEMIFDAAPSKLPKTDRALYKDAKDNAVRAGNGNKSTNESLEEDLTMTLPEPYYSEDRDEFYLKVGINGSTYDFKMKDDSPYSIDQMLNKVIKMMNYSSGKALAFMKKHMIGVKSSKMNIQESHDPFTYEEVDSKQVRDADGFLQDYTWYRRSDGLNIFLLADKDYIDLDEVGDYESDWETENDEEAREWFDNYEGFEDEDEDDPYYDEFLNESEEVDKDDLASAGFFPNPDGTPEYAKYKYDRRHGDKDVFKSKDYAIKNKNKDLETESVDPSDLLELKSVSYQGLKDKLTKELNKVMKSPEFGFDDDDIKEYSGVEVKENEGQIYVSVWAEVGFDALWTIKDALDPIIAKYDKDAYFDMEDAGRLLAVIFDTELKESGNPFKSHHICKGCGKPLDQCTCEVDDEDKVNEDLTVGESLNDSIAVKMSRDDFDRMCRENSILQGLSHRDYIEIRDLFNIGYDNFDAAVNDLWHSDDDYHDREWYVNLLKKYTNSVKKSADSESLKESVTFSDYMLDNNSILHSTSELLKDYKTTTPTKFICPKDEYPLVELSSEDGEHILQCIHCQAQYAYEDDDPETIVDLDNIDESLSKSLNEDTQLKFDDDMINDIEVLHMWRPEEVERILIKHGSDKNNDNWIDGLDLPAAYDEIMSTFRDKYSDYDEIDYDVAKVLGLVEESLNEGLSPEKGDRVRMDHYSKVNNGQEGTVTGRLGELCWVTWDDGTKSKEIKGYLTVIERDGKVVDESLNNPYTVDDKWTRIGPDDDSNTLVSYKRYPFIVERRYIKGNDKKVTERWMLKKYDIGRQVYLPIRTYSSKEEAMRAADDSPVFKKAKFKLSKKESATQSSSIGQHKVDSIDLLEPKEALNLDSEGKRLKKLISQLVLDSDEELRDYVNKIIDEVIEERNGGSDDE